MLHEYLELSCTVLVGSSMQPGGAGIKEAFWRANAAVSQRFYASHDGVLLWRQDMEQTRQDSYSLSGVRAELSEILISGTPEELIRFVDQVLRDHVRGAGLRLSQAGPGTAPLLEPDHCAGPVSK